MITTLVNAVKTAFNALGNVLQGIVELFSFIGIGSVTIMTVFEYLPSIFATIGGITIIVLVIKFAVGRANS